MIYDYVIVGAGITGLNVARLLRVKYPKKNICLVEKSNKIGGLISTKYKKPENIKIEAGPAVVYSYQKNILKLIQKYNIETFHIDLDTKDSHVRNYYHCDKKNTSCGKELTKKHLNMFKRVFKYMDSKGKKFCRDFTFEQICVQVLTSQETAFLEFCYGYSLDFKEANSVSARKNIENELFNSKKMYFFKNGYNELSKHLFEDIKKKNIEIKFNLELCDFFEHRNNLKLLFNKKQTSLIAKKIILCVPKKSLVNNCDSFTRKELRLFDSIQSGSLCRLFVQYDIDKKQNEWMKNIKFSSVNNPIRQIIPIKKSKGLFQISYTDWHLADYWGNLPEKSWYSLVKIFLKEIFPTQKIDNPIWLKRYYFKDAIHCWKPFYNDTYLYKKIMKLRKNVFIAGESFSKIQGWCEGAIISSIDVVKMV